MPVLSCFMQGTYRNGERSGEGVLTYPACRQDVGVWCGDRLVQLRFTVHEAMAPLHAGSRVLHTPDNANRGDYLPKGPLEVHNPPSRASCATSCYFLYVDCVSLVTLPCVSMVTHSSPT